MNLTNEQIDKYLDNSYCCPFCGSEDLEWGPIDIEDTEAYQEVTCQGCGKEWQDVYKQTAPLYTDDKGDWHGYEYQPPVWLVTVSNEVGLCFRAVADSEVKAHEALEEWCGWRWQEMDEPDGEGCLEKEGSVEEAIDRYFAFMDPEEDYEIMELRLWSPAHAPA